MRPTRVLACTIASTLWMGACTGQTPDPSPPPAAAPAASDRAAAAPGPAPSGSKAPPPAEGTAAAQAAPNPDSPIDEALLEAVKTPSHTGTLTIEAVEQSSGTRDTCTGPVALISRSGALDGVARCTFTGDLSQFGTTLGRVRASRDQATGSFDASPSPVLAEGPATWTETGLELRFGDSLDVGDQRVVTYTGTIRAERVTAKPVGTE